MHNNKQLRAVLRASIHRLTAHLYKNNTLSMCSVGGFFFVHQTTAKKNTVSDVITILGRTADTDVSPNVSNTAEITET